jgi:hypothetical protein
VAFVCLTNEGRTQAEMFVEQFGIEWPCGYEATLESVARFGAYHSAWMSSADDAGREVSPTLYLIGPDGRVRWSDDQARPRHLHRPEVLLRKLEAAIQRALAQGDPS